MMGRPRAIESPEKMWELFLAYKKATKAKPILVKDWVGAMATEVKREKERPLTFEGFECFVWDEGIAEGVEQYFSNRNERYNDFLDVCTRIRKAIRDDQIGGGMAGIYNPSITQRLNGLVEKVQEDGSKEVTIKVKYERKDSNTEPTPQEPAADY